METIITILILITIGVVVTVLIGAGFGEKAFTCRCSSGGGLQKGHTAIRRIAGT